MRRKNNSLRSRPTNGPSIIYEQLHFDLGNWGVHDSLPLPHPGTDDPNLNLDDPNGGGEPCE
jgi:hypothetical protein